MNTKIEVINAQLTEIASMKATLIARQSHLEKQREALIQEQQGQLTLTDEQESRLKAQECGTGGCE